MSEKPKWVGRLKYAELSRSCTKWIFSGNREQRATLLINLKTKSRSHTVVRVRSFRVRSLWNCNRNVDTSSCFDLRVARLKNLYHTLSIRRTYLTWWRDQTTNEKTLRGLTRVRKRITNKIQSSVGSRNNVTVWLDKFHEPVRCGPKSYH